MDLQEVRDRRRRLERENAALRREIRRLKTENARLRRLGQKESSLRRVIGRLKTEISRLRELLEKSRRSGKRQAAPFSKGDPKSNPKRPGRRPGARYGRRGRRPIPDHVDAVVEAPLPGCCEHCAGELELLAVQPQYQTELPPIRPHVTRIDVAVGRCRCCGRRARGRHPLQTSEALGAAASQLGPKALALAAHLNKGLGLSFGKVSALYATAFGIVVTPGGLCLALHRLSRAGEPTYQALVVAIRQSPVNAADETGWKVGGLLQWLWAFVGLQVTVYAIQSGRGYEEACRILGEDYAGKLLRDGWAPYRQFTQAIHQTCLTHLLRRCHDILETAQRGAARFPHAVQSVLQDSLELRDRRDAGEISPHGLAVVRGRLEARMDRLLAWRPTDTENHKLVKHLRNERPALFTFLRHPEVEAANWWGEQAIRPAVVTRKVCGGNRTWTGAHTQEVLMSILRTCHQQGADFYGLIEDLLRSPKPRVAAQLFSSTHGPPA